MPADFRAGVRGTGRWEWASFAVRLLVEVFDRELEVVTRDLVAGDRLHRLVAASAAANDGHDGEGDHRGDYGRSDNEQASHGACIVPNARDEGGDVVARQAGTGAVPRTVVWTDPSGVSPWRRG